MTAMAAAAARAVAGTASRHFQAASPARSPANPDLGTGSSASRASSLERNQGEGSGGGGSAARRATAPARRSRAARQVAQHLELLEDYEVVASLGDVETPEDAAVVASLDELTPRREGRP